MIIKSFRELVDFKDTTLCKACEQEASDMLIHLTMNARLIVTLHFDTDCEHTESERRGIDEGSNE